MDTKTTGLKAEQIARSFLEKKGYRFLTANFHSPFGEIDLIFSHQKTVIFVEVKARASNQFGSPAEAVTPKKLEKIRKTAAIYFEANPMVPQSGQIDVVEVDLSHQPPNCSHLENVFFET